MTSTDVLFALAVLKGAIDAEHAGNPDLLHRHFGSMLGIIQHADLAAWLGLTTGAGVNVRPTAYGRDFYARHGMGAWPDGRAYLTWGAVAAAAVAELADKEAPR